MASNPGPLLFGAAAAALLLMGRRRNGAAEDDADVTFGGSRLKGSPHADEDDPPEEELESYEGLVAQWEDPNQNPRIGRFYQVKPGDTLLTVSREALFGSREARREPRERQAVIELSVRIDCSPWNQATSGRDREFLQPGHIAVEEGWTPRGVAFDSIHSPNRDFLRQGLPPSVAKGDSFPYIWIPMIDLELLELRGEVTTFGQDYDDDGRGSYSMIDPPPWVIDLGFADVFSPITVGCNLPERDFTSVIVPD